MRHHTPGRYPYGLWIPDPDHIEFVCHPRKVLDRTVQRAKAGVSGTMRRILFACLFWVSAAIGAAAQDLVWIQVEAQPSLRSAEDRVRSYAVRLPDVAGFQQSRNWYAIALGPYERVDAERLLRQLRGAGQIPRDSFIARTAAYQTQFWPIGANDLIVAEAAAPAPEPQPLQPEPTENTDTPVAQPDETVQQARQSERLLTRDERKELQVALQWAGYYSAAIDGAYGRGTRRSMGDWQTFKGYEPTGVLTTRQRAELLRDYNAILDGMNMAEVADAQAGISLQMPTGVVAFAEYEPPFAHYRPTGDLKGHISLISQEGSRARFQGLFNVLQTLEMVPAEGPRKLNQNSFQIEGKDNTYHTTIDVTFSNGVMKGYMFVWPANDDQRRTRVFDLVKASFATLDGTLDPSISEPTEDQRVDLLAGLEIKTPKQTATGFFTDPKGTVLTHVDAVGSCSRVSIESEVDMDVLLSDAKSGLAVLKPKSPTSPLAHATFQTSVPRLKDQITVAGFSYGGLLGAPTLTQGQLEDLRGLAGEDTVKRLAIEAQPGDAGGPVFDRGGAVLGLLQPAKTGARQLPKDVGFATDTDTIRSALNAAGLSLTEASSQAVMAPEDLSLLAEDITVLVECW